MGSSRTDKEYRIGIIAVLLALLFLIIIAGLFYHQVILRKQYTIQSENNRIRVVPIAAPRGLVLDREGSDRVTQCVQHEVIGHE